MTSYTYNPYSSTPPSFESVLRTLTQSRVPASLSTVRSLQQQLKEKNTEWTFELANSFSSYIFRLFENLVSTGDGEDTDTEGANSTNRDTGNVAEGSLGALHLWTMATEEWQDDILYAVLVHEEGNRSINCGCKNLITLLVKLARKQQHALANIAMIGVSVACQALDRIQTLTSVDSTSTDFSWWLTENDAIELASCALRRVLDGSAEIESVDETITSPNNKKVKLSCLVVLLTMFKHDVTSSLTDMTEDQAAHLCRQLLSQTQSLTDPNMTPQSRYDVPGSLASASLLCMIKSKSSFDVAEYDRLIHTSDFVENLVQFTFPSPEESSYRCAWASHDPSEGTWQYALETIRCWNLSHNEEWSIFEKLECKWRYFVDDFWVGLLQNRENNLPNNISGLFFLQTKSRLQARAIMLSSLQRASDDIRKPCQTILVALLRLMDHSSFSIRIYSARLLWVFLSDSRKVCTHDELSRAFWQALDGKMVDACVTKAIEHTTTEDLQQPILITLFDIVNSHLQIQENTDRVLNQLGAESVEKLIHVVDPTSIRVDYMESFYEETQAFSQTPPANNLSRMDEKSICFEQEEVKEPRGLDNAVRTAAATFLAKLCYSSAPSSDEGVNVLSSRISTAVNDFLIDYQQMDDSLEAICHSLDLNKRLFRLKLAMSTPENEDFVLTMEHTNKKLQQRRFHRLMEENKKIQGQLGRSLRREQQLEKDTADLKERYHSLSILSKREMSRKGKQATQEARRLIAIHAAERSKAESRLSEALQSAKRHEDELRDAKAHAEDCQKRATDLDAKLRETVLSAAEMERQTHELQKEAGAREEKLQQYHVELDARGEALNTAQGRCQDLEDQIRLQNESISGVEDTNEQLRQNLEDLFADMSSLAQIYSFKEKEEAANKEAFAKQVDAAQRRIDEEKQQNEETATKLEDAKTENQKLYRKLEKYKMKMEEDRREREEETQRRKRNGPVSYINQLHNSSNIADKSSRDRSSIRTESSKARRRDESSRYEKATSVRKASSSQSRKRDESSSRYEKENSSYYYASAASQARKRS